MLSINKKNLSIGITLLFTAVAIFVGFIGLQKPKTIQNRAAQGKSVTCSWTTSIPNEYTFSVKLVDPQGVLIREEKVKKKVSVENEVTTHEFTGLTASEIAMTACQVALFESVCPSFQSELYTCTESPTPPPPFDTPTPNPSISVSPQPPETDTPAPSISPSVGPSPTVGPLLTPTAGLSPTHGPTAKPTETTPTNSCPNTKLNVHIDCLQCSQ